MTVSPIENGIVLDHITAGKGMELYKALGLDELDCLVAVINNAFSKKVKGNKKDIIKIDAEIDLNLDIIGYFDPGITVNVIKNGVNTKMSKIEAPEKIEGIIKCKNPRCITSVEQELPNIFKLTDRENMVYRCIYCESKAK
ncbi:MAG: aspartate carbamoyltransferase regulatory subunit [Acutalibacteraceae bacterium]|nr:aspartate carbamoyltransferase regulatory subunit [Acutalibacteraceae bacterium]